MSKNNYKNNVFINCPFDKKYSPLLDVILFTVFYCSYNPRIALEISDGTETRIEKIKSIISECAYGIHDISRTSLDPRTKLPRFNMPLELGIFLGAKYYGNKIQNRKRCLILDKNKYRYQKFISDIAGQDIEHHEDKAKKIISLVCNWLQNYKTKNHKQLILGETVHKQWKIFMQDAPKLCTGLDKQNNRKVRPKLTHQNLLTLIPIWIKENEKRKRKILQ